MCVVISCESGGELVPSFLIDGNPDSHEPPQPPLALSSLASPTLPSPSPNHRNLNSGGWRAAHRHRYAGDRHARWAADTLARSIGAPLVRNVYSPDLINVARSIHHRELFPSKKQLLDTDQRRALIDAIYVPYREQLRRRLAGMMMQHSFVVHLAVGTFPLYGKRHGSSRPRRADIGLAYDPSSDDEVDFCLDWIDELYDEAEMLRVRRNYPRRGTHDCITKAMRAEFAGMNYVGIEILLNQAWTARPSRLRQEAMDGIVWSLKTLTSEMVPAESNQSVEAA